MWNDIATLTTRGKLDKMRIIIEDKISTSDRTYLSFSDIVVASTGWIITCQPENYDMTYYRLLQDYFVLSVCYMGTPSTIGTLNSHMWTDYTSREGQRVKLV